MCTLLKESKVAAGSVVSFGTVVAGKHGSENEILMGSPVKAFNKIEVW